MQGCTRTARLGRAALAMILMLGLAAGAAAELLGASPELAGEVASGEAVVEAVVEGVVEGAPIEALPGTPAMDAAGNRGHIHVVTGGDTLWDISSAYLETPWTWPAIWKDNRAGIENPHLIYPGDRIWISPTEMRRISPAEADQFIAAAAAAPLMDPADASAWTAEGPIAMDSLSVSSLNPGAQSRTVRVSGVNDAGFISAAELESASSVLDSPMQRVFISQGDDVFVGLGQGETEVGARYTIFREAEPVRDFETNALYGYHVNMLGWLEIKSVGPETSVAKVRMSKDVIERGDHIVPRTVIPLELDARPAPMDVDGRIIFMPASRTQAAMADFVYLDQGSIHGLEVGHLLEVFDAGSLERDTARGSKVMTPDWNVASLIVTKVQADSAVAFVTHARRELAVGDAVRSTATQTAMR